MGVRRASSILGNSGDWGSPASGVVGHWHPWRGPSIHLTDPYCGRQRTNPALPRVRQVCHTFPVALGLVGFILLLWFIF